MTDSNSDILSSVMGAKSVDDLRPLVLKNADAFEPRPINGYVLEARWSIVSVAEKENETEDPGSLAPSSIRERVSGALAGSKFLTADCSWRQSNATTSQIQFSFFMEGALPVTDKLVSALAAVQSVLEVQCAEKALVPVIDDLNLAPLTVTHIAEPKADEPKFELFKVDKVGASWETAKLAVADAIRADASFLEPITKALGDQLEAGQGG